MATSDGRPGTQAWKALPRDVRHDVIRRAGYGERHPDPVTAAVGAAWAREYLARWWNRPPGLLLPIVSGGFAAYIYDYSAAAAGVGLAGMIGGLQLWRQRRMARDVAAAETAEPGPA